MGVARVRGWFTQRNREQVPKRKEMPPLLRGIPPPIGTPLIKGGRGDRT